MHGMYQQQIKELPDTEMSYQLLDKSGLKVGTEKLIITVRTQALSTKAIASVVYYIRPQCILQDPHETVMYC